MKEKIEKFLKDGRAAILAIFILQLILMIFITPNKYDDASFLKSLETNSVTSLVKERYYEWTSRVIIEFTLFTVLKTSKYLWIFIQACMMALIGYSISKLFVKKENKTELNTMILLMILAYPMDIMASAGWAATTTNYMWPLATALFALIPIKKAWDKEKIKIYQYPLYILSLLYACNQEQTCAIVFGVYLLFTVLLILRDKKKIHPFVIIQLILAIASLIFVLTAPGNYVRKDTEIESFFKDFEMLTIQDKISVGLTLTMGNIVKTCSVPFAFFSLMIATYIFTTYKEKLYRVVSIIPLLTISVLGIFSDIIFDMFPYLGAFTEILTKQEVILTAANCNNLLYVLPLMLSMVVFLSIILSLLLIFKNLKNNIAVLVFLVGLASRLIMGFSPTMFASSVRTILFLDFAMLIAALLIWQEFIKKTDKNEKKVQKRVYSIVTVTAIVQYLNVLVAILITQK